jgi:hypothetical protein
MAPSSCLEYSFAILEGGIIYRDSMTSKSSNETVIVPATLFDGPIITTRVQLAVIDEAVKQTNR